MRVASGPDEVGACRHCQTMRVRRARSEGVTRRVNWCPTPRNREAVLEPGGYGPVCSALAFRRFAVVVGGTPKPSSSSGGEAMVKVCGVAVAMLPGYSQAPT